MMNCGKSWWECRTWWWLLSCPWCWEGHDLPIDRAVYHKLDESGANRERPGAGAEGERIRSGSRALGTPPLQIIVTHLLPNTLSLIIINTTFSIPSFIFAEAFLSFVGMGNPAAADKLGALWPRWASSRCPTILLELIFPALAISVTMLAFNLLGDGLRDAFDPKLRQ